MDNDRPTGTPAFELLSAIASGDTSPEEGAAHLRREGLDALDVLAELVAHAGQGPERLRNAQQVIDIRGFSDTAASEVPTVHRTPRVPFLLNGTLYDPEDIHQFDGTELHFVAAGDRLLAVEERAVIAEFWRTSYLIGEAERGVDFGGIYPTYYRSKSPWEPTYCELRPDLCPPTWPPPRPPSPPPPPPVPPPSGTRFFEHLDGQGDTLIVPPNRAYQNLTKVGRGFLGLGDWNDITSSVWMVGTRFAVLCEHVNYGGSTLTLSDAGSVWGGPLQNLLAAGWNDRASSVQTW